MVGSRLCALPLESSGVIDPATAEPAVRLVRHLRSGLSVRLTDVDDLTRAAVHGEIDLDCADMLEHVLADALEFAPDGLEVDLAAVAFFDCAGLNALLRVRDVARRKGAGMKVTAMSPAVRRVVDLTQSGQALCGSPHTVS
ncbi:STAS domain-containing protein [Streptomyces sp. NPDC051976]|uniref:STAS domain-containing protein n=1 Tax=Streptomyces sp. NPDC051976 TaxID=3154947 RepID=UPI0034477672